MQQTVEPTQAEIDALSVEYQAYVEGLRVDWLAQNQVKSRDVYEVMRPEEQAGVHQRIAQWGYYITPFAEAWWKERGFGITWPEDNSKPIQVYRLDTTQAPVEIRSIEKDRKHEIGYLLLVQQLQRDGLLLNATFKNQLNEATSTLGIPEEDLRDFAALIVQDVLEHVAL